MYILTVADVVADMNAKKSKEEAQKAYAIFEEIYAKRDIRQTPNEILATKKSLKAIHDISAGALPGRYVLPLAAGSGKTTLIIAYCTFIHRSKIDYSVIIASKQVKDCFKLREQLIEQGIPEEDIGVIHSYSAIEMSKLINSCPKVITVFKSHILKADDKITVWRAPDYVPDGSGTSPIILEYQPTYKPEEGHDIILFLNDR